jgi:hypothetical protein
MTNYKTDNPSASNSELYHGIVVSLSQKDKSKVRSLDIIGIKKMLWGMLKLYKLQVQEDKLEETINVLQGNMSGRILFKKQEFYLHFYRGDELIIVYRDKVFRVSCDSSTWGEAIDYGKRMGILEKQLDFSPNRIDDEDF